MLWQEGFELIDALESGFEIVVREDIQRFVSGGDVMKSSEGEEEGLAVRVRHHRSSSNWSEVRRVYGDLHAERGYVTRKSCERRERILSL